MTLGLILFRPPVLVGLSALLLPGSIGNPGFPCGLCRRWTVVGQGGGGGEVGMEGASSLCWARQ